MPGLFLYGTLRHKPLLDLVLGHESAASAIPARLSGAQVYWVKGKLFPMIAHAPGEVATGILLPDVSREDQARLDFYEAGFDYETVDCSVQTYAGMMGAVVFWPGEGWVPGAPWRLEDWVLRCGDMTMIAAKEVMSQYGRRSPDLMAQRMPSIQARASSRLRAQSEQAPTSLRRKAEKGDVDLLKVEQSYTGFFAVEDLELRHRRFAGGMSDPIDRSVFVSADAATVLPYDPVTDRVLIIEQFRPGPVMRGDPQPWSLEAVAGRIDPGETPQEAILREAQEEAHLALDQLIPLSSYYPTPGCYSEYLYSFIGLADLSEVTGELAGLASEAEDIRSHVVPFERLMDLLESGEIQNAPLQLSALYLARLRPKLRAEAGAES